MSLTVSIGGLGTIGLEVARALDAGIEGLELVAVAGRDPQRLEAGLALLKKRPRTVTLAALAEADIVLEALPAACFREIAEPAVRGGKVLLACSAGALLRHDGLIAEARATGARIIVPTGAILGLDAVRAAAEGTVHRARMVTRKPPDSLVGAPYLLRHGIEVADVTEPRRVFAGNAYDAAEGFPANINVAAALALAGVGPARTEVEIWADPALSRNTHTIEIDCDAAHFKMTIEGIPSPGNPKTGRLTANSVIACLRGMVSTLKVGS